MDIEQLFTVLNRLGQKGCPSLFLNHSACNRVRQRATEAMQQKSTVMYYRNAVKVDPYEQ